jgi:small subunit ribosomal protein S17
MDSRHERRSRPTIIGSVVSAKMRDTIVVREEHRVLHPLYKKYVKRSSKFFAHDAGNTCVEGDVVEISFTRPLSKTKRWRLVRVLRAAPREAVPSVSTEA